MSPQWILVISPLIGQTANCVAHVLSVRVAHHGLLKSLVIGFTSGLLCDALVTLWACRLGSLGAVDCIGQLLLTVSTTGALGYGYFHFINLGETARRVTDPA